MVNKELIRKLISFDEGDTSTGHVSVSGGVDNLWEYQDLLRQMEISIKQQDLVGFSGSASEFITKACEEFGNLEDDTFSGRMEYYWFITDDEQSLDLSIQDIRKVTERFRQGSNFYLEIIGIGNSEDEGALLAVTYDSEYKDSPLTIRKFRDLWWKGRPEMFIDMFSRFYDDKMVDQSYRWRNARAIHKYLTRLLQHLKFVQ